MNHKTKHFLQPLALIALLGGTLTAMADPAALTIKDPKALIGDDFTSTQYPNRNAARGQWKIADGSASVQQDDALYKKFKNHGPIMIYAVPHTDAHAVVEFKPTDCKTVVFTMDAAEGGHAFRIKLRTEGKTDGGPASQIVTYAAKEPGQEKAKQIVLNGKDLPKLVNNEWNRIEISVVGDQASVTLRDKTVHVQHALIAQKKKLVKLGFSFGGLAIRRLTLAGQ